MEPNKIVIQFKDGRILKGKTNDFFQNKKTFHLNKVDGRDEEVNIEKLKAVFFVKDIKGDNNYTYEYNDVVAGGGKKIAVDFPDGETIIGYVLGYSPERQGFMMTPADLRGNNERVFVVNSATKNVNFLTESQPLPKTPKPKSQDPLNNVDKRKYPRVASINLFSYVCFDEERKPLDQGMGKTLDIGLGGLLIETKVLIEAQYVLLMTLNIKEELIKIKGKVAYSRESEPKIFQTGIRFIEKNERIHEIVVDMMKTSLKKKRQ
jgi:hypothetical protein